MKKIISVCSAVLFMLSVATSVHARETKTDVQERLQEATKTLHQLLDAPDAGIPNEALEEAQCIAVVPHLLKGGFILAGRHGSGVATCRLPNGKWSAPAFFTISGGSWGAQIGVESIDLVMLIMNEQGARRLMESKFQIGGAASATAGPVGRTASAATTWKANTEILTYSRTKGLFAGVDLGGSWVQHDTDSTEALYGSDVPTTDILGGKESVPPAATPFVGEVEHAKAAAAAGK